MRDIGRLYYNLIKDFDPLFYVLSFTNNYSKKCGYNEK